MKTWLGFIGKTIAALLCLLILIVLFFTLQASLRETKTRQEAAPSTGRFVQAGDVELFIQEIGPARGEPILFIHGTAAWSELWRETMTPLAEAGYRCIAIDIPPFGFSERPAAPSYGNEEQARRIVALMDTLEIERAVLLGHSFGGGATVETALMIPDRVEALILLDVGGLNLNLPSTSSERGPSAAEIVLGVSSLRDPLLAATGTNPLFTRTLLSSMILDPADATDEKIEILQAPLVLKGATNTLGDWLQYVLTEQESSLTSDPANYNRLSMPVLVVWGDSDKVIPIEEGQYLNRLIPHAVFVVMSGVNHVPHVEDLDTLLEVVLEFLQSR